MNDQIRDLLPFYALDALTTEERARVEEFLKANPQRRGELAELLAGAEAVALDARPLQPDARVKMRLMARVRADDAAGVAPRPRPATPAPRLRLSLAFGLAAFAVLSLLLLAVWTASLLQQVRALDAENASLRGELADLTRQAGELEQQVEALDAQTQRLQQQLDGQSELVALLSLPAQTLTLNGLEPQAQARGQLRILDDARAVLAVSDLPPLPPDQVYQLWLFHDDVPVPAGTFETGDGGVALLALPGIDSPATLDAVAVSVEPAGGSLQPTGDVVLFGEV